MNQVSKVSNGIQVAEFAHLTGKFATWYDEYPAPKEDRFWTAINTKVSDLTSKLVVAINKSKVISRLPEADARRDAALTAIFSALEGYSRLPIAEKSQAAAALPLVADKYRGIARLDLASESAQIESFLTDLQSDEAKAALKALDGVSSIVTELREAEDNFKAEEKTLTVGKTEGGESATEVRKTLLAVVNDELVPHLNVAVRLDSATYEEVAKKISHEINEANSKVLQRGKKTLSK